MGAHRPGRGVAEGRRGPRLIERELALASRVCRVRPDVAGLDRTFDYLVPEPMAALVSVGTIVRVPLHGRRVRGWVVADGVEPETEPERLRPLLKVTSTGPPADVLALCDWAAWRYAGSVVALLRAASPPNAVAPAGVPASFGGVGSGRATPEPRLLVWPPAADRRELVAGLLSSDGSTIVILPDGARTHLLVHELEQRGRRAVVLRADQPDAQRSTAWGAARGGDCVVVGGRLAVFAPVPDLRAVVVLDEGDEALQEERSPTWNARELAAERARRAGAALTLVSPAPTLEAEAIAGTPLRQPRSVERAGWPILEVVDRRDEPPGFGLLSARLADALHAALLHGGRAVCVLNRRGRARLLACAQCGETACCERCAAAVVEAGDAGLACPRCATTRPRVCLRCHAARFKSLRPGVTRVRDDLDALLPRAEVAEVDAATDDVPPADVLVGTEAVLHRVPRVQHRPVRLVAFLEFDQELLAARYRATEQAMWLLVRGARLVGGRDGGGRLLVQTRVPDHEVLEAVRHADPSPVADAERERRRSLGYPPFGGLAELSGAPEAVAVAADALRRANVIVLGPVTSETRSRALVQAATVAALCDALGAAVPGAKAEGRLRVEVDPLRV